MQIRFDGRGIVQNAVRVETTNLQQILSETGKALIHLQTRSMFAAVRFVPACVLGKGIGQTTKQISKIPCVTIGNIRKYSELRILLPLEFGNIHAIICGKPWYEVQMKVLAQCCLFCVLCSALLCCFGGSFLLGGLFAKSDAFYPRGVSL